MLTSQIRSSFLKFFEDNGHEVVNSSSVVPQNDPSLLFTNAGMVQFKNVFTGLEALSYKRATTSQKCIRAGGKHNDLDQVGFTARHHTFFEMLGNFSFGDYFKEEAIFYAWTFLTKELCISPENLLVTVYHTDEEAKGLWEKIAGDVTIIPISTSDNFWSMGDAGPCGPCSEIFYDHGTDIFGGMPGTPDEGGDRYIEIWNIVFMQFEQIAGGKRIPLKNKSIDTGMGLERISSVMQGLHDNYETDIFRHIISSIRDISGTNYETTYPSYKVIADHIRSISFLMADGVVPSNEGRGYVLRRILRRAMRHGHIIGIREPFLSTLSGVLIDTMKQAYPELEKARFTIASMIHSEEEKFLDTLERGLKILQQDIKNIPTGGQLDGEIAFKLYDTYGFPLDLTQDILKTENISVDLEGFEESLEKQRNRAKWAGSGELKQQEIWLSLKKKLAPTNFIGYEQFSGFSKIVAIVQNEEEISELFAGKAYLVVESTPFYAECGGQCGDRGIIEFPDGVFQVTNTVKFCDTLIAHEGTLLSGNIAISSVVHLKIDAERRGKIMANHTATHLLHAALRQILGDHVAQRGSYLDDERLRFDFSHNSAISPENLKKIEALVNAWISEHRVVSHREMSRNEAINSGATALFGEKYGDSVRTICVGDSDTSTKSCHDSKISFELCGGTHVSNTSEIGLFKILSEASIGSGLRRIEAITSESILNYLGEIEELLQKASLQLKCTPAKLPQKISDLVAELKKRNHEISAQKQKTAIANLTFAQKSAAAVFSALLDDYTMEDLRALCDIIKAKYSCGTIGLLVSRDSDSDKTYIAVTVSSDLQSRFRAGDILKIGLDVLGGKGGGGAAFAQGGGASKSKAEAALNAMLTAI
ncbi:MAG: alanine--tRNA ligase [Holosporaceae bacterium]|jgi:alanyl-tRNA synthetase|nr:alanine--tRNA ligase [Holosporaceae bacterium]